MFKKIFASALLVFGLSLVPNQLAFAEGEVGDDHFSVFEVLCVGENCGKDNEATDGGEGTTDIGYNIVQDAEKYDGNIPVAIMMRVINILLLLIGTFAFLVLFYCGLLLVTSNGDEGKIEKGKGMIMPAILGLVFAFLAYYIASFVQSFFY